MCEYPYYYAWKNNEKRATLYKRRFKIVARGKMNSVLVEFVNGQREVISGNAVRKVKHEQGPGDSEAETRDTQSKESGTEKSRDSGQSR